MPQLLSSKYFSKLPIQESTSILLSLRNLGESTFNITTITWYLHAAHRFGFYVQNVCPFIISFHSENIGTPMM